MPIAFTCPQCHKQHNAPDSLAGKAARCKCGAVVHVPLPSKPEPDLLPPLPPLFDKTNSSQPLRPLQVLPAHQRRARQVFSWKSIALIAGGVVAAIMILGCCGGLYSLTQPPAPSAAARKPFVYSAPRSPPLPERGTWAELEPHVLHQELSLGTPLYMHEPGHGGKFWVYLPAAGENARKSLPCILIAPAGSTLLTGMALGEADRAEHLPYVRSGMVVIAYELDGTPDAPHIIDPVKHPYMMFRVSQAGLINARIALEFAIQKMPEVDPTRIYAAGHSSAATHALLFAEHETRLAGVIAYAPALNLPRRFGAALRIESWQLPGVVDFVTQSSPDTHIDRLRCPTFFFQAEDDYTCPLPTAKEFVDRLKQQGTDVKFVTVPSGGHYDSMISQGIPAGIQWIQERNQK